MKITRDGNSFAVEVERDDQAEVLDALLKTIALTIAAPPMRKGSGSNVEGLTLTLNLRADARFEMDDETRRSADLLAKINEKQRSQVAELRSKAGLV